MTNIRAIVAACSILCVQGCAGFEDSKLVVGDRGPAQVFPSSPFEKDKVLSDEGVATNPGPLGIFVDSYINSLKSPDDSALAFKMATNGYDLVDHYCQMFFQAGGENQKWLDLSKDLVAALGTLGTGIAALAAGSAGSTTAVIALSTATAYNGIDIYTRNFLFGTDNIASVQTLIINALTAHRQATVGATSAPAAQWTFGSAILQIEAHQTLCQSAKIRDLVLQAIKGGTVTAFTPAGSISTSGGSPPPPAAAPAAADPTAHVSVKAGS